MATTMTNGLKKQIAQTIENLPESALMELVTFLDYLQYRNEFAHPSTAAPYTPVSLRGLWQGTEITDEAIEEMRREMWAGWGERDL